MKVGDRVQWSTGIGTMRGTIIETNPQRARVQPDGLTFPNWYLWSWLEPIDVVDILAELDE